MPPHRLLRIALLAPATATWCTPFKTDSPDPFEAGSETGVPVLESSGSSPTNASAPCSPTAKFGAPRLVAGLENVGSSIGAVRLSPDTLTAYFQAAGGPNATGLDDLYTATRASAAAPFGDVSPLQGYEVNSPQDELYPTVSGDGLTLVFARSGPMDPIFLWSTTRSVDYTAFNVPARLPAPANATNAQYDTTPFLREDGTVLYFASNRIQANGFDLYRVAWAGPGDDAAFDEPAPIEALNGGSNELAPTLTPDDQTIYFASDRASGNGDYDIWMATRPPDALATAMSMPTLVAELSSNAADFPTFITRDGCTLYFSSARSGSLLPYVATRGR